MKFLLNLLLNLILLGGVVYFIAFYIAPNSVLTQQIKSNLTSVTGKPHQTIAPSSEIADLAAKAHMTDLAKTIFYSTNPEIDYDRATFNEHCQAPAGQEFVELGCFTTDNHIYILGLQQPQIASEMVVVAAHEMLHAAYTQLPIWQRPKINQEVEAAFAQVKNRELSLEMRNYRQTEPGERDNELHSILGTEFNSLPADLESYYQQYFTNRPTVIADYVQFQQAFSSLETQLNQLETQITSMRTQMKQLLKEGRIVEYNALVPQVNALIRQYNAKVADYNSLSRSLRGEEPTVNNNQ